MINKEVIKFVISLLKKGENVEQKHIDTKSVDYLVSTAISIFEKKEKKTYEKNFEELRLRGIYSDLKPMVSLFEILSNIFNNKNIVSLLNNMDFEKLSNAVTALNTDSAQLKANICKEFNITIPFKVKKFKELSIINDSNKF